MMAEAGYHPAYIFALQNTLRALGDASQFKAFFSDHPRWKTRADRSFKAYSDAVIRFESHWPDPELSPGGMAPPVVTLGKPETHREKSEGLAVIELPVLIKGGAGQELLASVVLQHKGRRISSALTEYSDRTGLFLAKESVEAPARRFRVKCPEQVVEGGYMSARRQPESKTEQAFQRFCDQEITLLGKLDPDGKAQIQTSDGESTTIPAKVIEVCEGTHESVLTFQLPTTALPGKERKLKAQVCVTNTKGVILNCSKRFDIKFPKPRPTNT